MEAISKSMDLNSSTYENFILLSDFNGTAEFCNFYSFTGLINTAAWLVAKILQSRFVLI